VAPGASVVVFVVVELWIGFLEILVQWAVEMTQEELET